MNEDARSFLQHAKLLSVAENWAYNDSRNKLRSEFHALMKERDVDIIVCPAYVGSAPVRQGTDYGTYTMLWNMLDHPALVFPTGDVVDVELDPVDVKYTPTNPIDKQQFDKCEFKRDIYLSSDLLTRVDDPKVFAGAPLSLQVVGKHLRDEETVAAARLIEQIMLGKNPL